MGGLNFLKNVCIVVASRANYGRVRSVIHAVHNHPQLNLQLIVNGSAVLERFGNISKIIRAEGIPIEKEFFHMVEGGNPISQSLSTGLGLIELSHAFRELKPNIVLTIADRFETMATAIAASYQNIPLGHIQGGEVSGNIDELVRHSISKLSHYHFPSTELSMERLIKLGEERSRILLSGCPSLDLIVSQSLSLDSLINMPAGVGSLFDYDKPFILMIFHPETEDYDLGDKRVSILLDVLSEIDIQKLVLWPNIDSGTDLVSKTIRRFREKGKSSSFTYYKNLTPQNYNILLNNAKLCVGNSSSFIRECSFLGTPSIITGIRQFGREHSDNAIFSGYDREELINNLENQLNHGKYKKSNLFGDGKTADRIANFISNTDLNIRKKITF